MKEETIVTLIVGGIGLVATLIGTISGTALGGWIAWRIARVSNKVQEAIARDNARFQRQAFLDTLVLKMSEFLMQYPHLEKDDFCQKYPNIPGEKNIRERYEAYCCFVFNVLSMAFSHFDGDRKKLAEYIMLDEILTKHHLWWKEDPENLKHGEPFRQCIQAVIDNLRSQGKIK